MSTMVPNMRRSSRSVPHTQEDIPPFTPPPVTNTAREIYKSVHETQELKTTADKTVSLVMLYTAANIQGIRVEWKKLCARADVELRAFKKAHGKLKDLVRQRKVVLPRRAASVLESSSSDKAKSHVPRIVSRMSLSEATRQAAVHVVRRAYELHKVDGRTPQAVAAAAILLAARTVAS
ncbi:MAG: hypothetical protein MHM6MM_007791 [Cercozoa sp. M6MM]